MNYPSPTSDLKRFLEAKTYEKTRVPVEEASTLPPDTYRLAEYHSLESNKVFGSSWVCVGYTSQIAEPGQVLRAQVSGQPIMVTKDNNHKIRGFYNTCRHRASLLVEEDQKISRFRCPYHSWTYDLDGSLQKCPLFDMARAPTTENDKQSDSCSKSSSKPSFNKADYSLLPIRVETWGCFVFVNLNNQAEPLSDYLGDLSRDYANFPLSELVLVRRKKYEIKANWKLIAENFLEYYHLPWVHPELCEVTAIDLHKRNQGAGMYMSFYANPLLKSGSALDADYAKTMPGLSLEEQNSGYFPYVFPNLAMFLLPTHLFVLLMTPDSISQTSECGDLLVHPSFLEQADAQSKIDEIFKFYDMVNIQDINAVERVQQGILSQAYEGGRMSYRFEEPVHRFQNMVIDYMTNQRRSYPADKSCI